MNQTNIYFDENDKQKLKEFTGRPVELPAMLDARERRVWLQTRLLSDFPGVLISFTLNIPGPVKVLDHVPDAFAFGIKEIVSVLTSQGLHVFKHTLILDKTGPEILLNVDADALRLKKLLVPIEDHKVLGRLFDIDVIDREGKKVSRSDIGGSGRTCLLCGKPAKECSRSRSHSVTELVARIEEIFKETFEESL